MFSKFLRILKKSGAILLALLAVTACSGPVSPDQPATQLAMAVPTEQDGYAMGMGFAQDPGSRGLVSTSAIESRAVGKLSGIDVSVYQGSVDWAAVKKAGKDFAFIRACYGTGSIDSRYSANWQNAKAAGVIRGAYQFFRPSQDALQQAQVFLKYNTTEDGDLAPVIDIEVSEGVSGAVITEKVKTWLNAVKAATGRTPIIYTSPAFWRSLPNTGTLGGYTLWIANWGVSSPGIPSPWTNWTFWQYSETGSVSGISGAVDLNYFNGDLTSLKALANTPAPQPEPTPAFEAPFTRQLFVATPLLSGKDVELAQILLNDWAKHQNLATLTADGYYGNNTEALVKKFQTAQALASDGIAGPKTLNKLVAVYVGQTTWIQNYYRTLSVKTPMLNGGDVTDFQNAYNVWAGMNGKAPIAADGWFGNESSVAVKAFQTAEQPLLGTPDGLAGAHTLRLLFVRTWK